MMHTHKILVVDDDLDVRASLLEVVELLGFDSAYALNGEDALRKLAEAPLPCLILLDWSMPVMDGESFLKEKAKLPVIASIPTIVLTATPMKARKLTTAPIMPKPLDLGELSAAVESHCLAKTS